MTYFWVDADGNVARATSVIPDPLPDHLKGLTPLDSREVGAPVSGKQTWGDSKWSAPPPAPQTLPLSERVNRMETALKARGVLTDADLEGRT